jgi:hypothetical protein
VREGRRWLRLRTTATRAERRLARWAADAAFVRQLGLEPAEVLGPPPPVPAGRAPVADPPPAEDDAEVREPVLVGT